MSVTAVVVGCGSSGRGVRAIRALSSALGLFPSVDVTVRRRGNPASLYVEEKQRKETNPVCTYDSNTLYTSSFVAFFFLFFLRVDVLASASCPSSFGSAARTALMGR